jgi:hypothetical protein
MKRERKGKAKKWQGKGFTVPTALLHSRAISTGKEDVKCESTTVALIGIEHYFVFHLHPLTERVV